MTKTVTVVIALALAAAGGYMALMLGKGGAEANPPHSSIPPPEQPQTPDKPSTGSTTSVGDVANGNNAFAFNMYAQLGKSEAGNLFFSPYSIDSVLAMAAEGAGGQTASEILSAGSLRVEPIARQQHFVWLNDLLNKPSAEYQLSVANALWTQQDFPLKPGYVSAVKDYYSGAATNLDFAKDTDAARLTINKWVEDRTQDKIKDLFPPGSLTPLTRLVLTNAIYFKGKWQYEFDPNATHESTFHVGPDKDAQAQFMGLEGGKQTLQYGKSADWQAVELPYRAGELSMLAVLPGEGQPLAELEAGLDSAKWESLQQALAPTQVVVQLPKFKFDTKYTLNEQLQALGMQDAFGAKADFSGMADGGGIFIDLVIHQAFVAVDEAGTEAAAATGMAAAGSAAPPSTKPEFFIADRPFLFAIKHNATGAILFMGRVADPTK